MNPQHTYLLTEDTTPQNIKNMSLIQKINYQPRNHKNQCQNNVSQDKGDLDKGDLDKGDPCKGGIPC